MLIYKEEFLDFIKDKLKLLRFNYAKTEIMTYCPFCEGITGKKHGHLYISTSKPLYYCHRCNQSGFLSDLLTFLDCNFSVKDILTEEGYQSLKNNVDNITDTNEVISRYKDNKKRVTNNELKKLNLKLLKTDRSVYINNKLEYISNRLKIPKDKVLNIRNICLTIELFFDKLKERYTLNLLRMLEINYVGFLGFFGNLISFRCVNNADDDGFLKRYYTIKCQDGPDFYLLKDSEMNQDLVNIVISEGVFDVLQTYYSGLLKKYYGEDFRINYWCSCFGRSFYHRTLSLLPLVIGCTYFNVYVLSDSDTTVSFYKNLTNLVSINKLVILYSNKTKDFGEYGIDPKQISSFTLL